MSQDINPKPNTPSSANGGNIDSGLPKFRATQDANRTYQVPSITLTAAYLRMWKLYTNFHIRSTRGEYWKANIVNTVVILVLLLALIVAHSVIVVALYSLYSLAIVVPSLAITIRRLHDTDHSGWWFFVGLVPLVGTIILFVLMVQPSTPGENRYGVAVTSLS